MKKVLIIASLYGSKRVVGLATYLSEFGWQPTVITPKISWRPTIISPDKLPNLPFEVIETDYSHTREMIIKALRINTVGEPRAWFRSLIKFKAWDRFADGLLGFASEIYNYPDHQKDWYKYALKASESIIKNYDAIMSICPVTSHMVASELKRNHNIYWLADFPDLWSGNASYSYGKIRKYFDKKIELKTMRNVDVITSTSQPWAWKLSILHNKYVRSIPLGFNHRDYDSKVQLNSKFNITFTGLIYIKECNPVNLLQAISELLGNQISRDDIEVNFYGANVKWFDDEIKQYQLSDVVHQCGLVPHEVAVQKQKESQILLLLDYTNPQELGAYYGKTFEYLGARRPILAIGGVHNNAVDNLLKETKAGIHAFTVEEIKIALLNYYKEYKKCGEVKYHGIEYEIQKHNHREMARKFADLLNQGVG